MDGRMRRGEKRKEEKEEGERGEERRGKNRRKVQESHERAGKIDTWCVSNVGEERVAMEGRKERVIKASNG